MQRNYGIENYQYMSDLWNVKSQVDTSCNQLKKTFC